MTNNEKQFRDVVFEQLTHLDPRCPKCNQLLLPADRACIYCLHNKEQSWEERLAGLAREVHAGVDALSHRDASRIPVDLREKTLTAFVFDELKAFIRDLLREVIEDTLDTLINPYPNANTLATIQLEIDRRITELKAKYLGEENITVTLKTKDGADPSAADPIYLNVGGRVREISGPLSVTMTPGTNWSNYEKTWLERIPLIGSWFTRRRMRRWGGRR